MTTPERFRRRQIVEGVILILLAIFSVGQTVAFQNEDSDQRECVEDKFRELTVALDARSDLAGRESRASQNVWDVYARAAGLLKDDPTEELPPAEQEQLQRDLVAALLDYQDTMNDVRRQRAETPYPPYPVGICD